MFLNGYMTLSRCINLYLGKNVCKRGFSLFFQDNEEGQDKEEKAPK